MISYMKITIQIKNKPESQMNLLNNYVRKKFK